MNNLNTGQPIKSLLAVEKGIQLVVKSMISLTLEYPKDVEVKL